MCCIYCGHVWCVCDKPDKITTLEVEPELAQKVIMILANKLSYIDEGRSGPYMTGTGEAHEWIEWAKHTARELPDG